jgi:hypothetical protein
MVLVALGTYLTINHNGVYCHFIVVVMLFRSCGGCIDDGGDHTQGGFIVVTTHRVQSTHDLIGLFGGGRNDET